MNKRFDTQDAHDGNAKDLVSNASQTTRGEREKGDTTYKAPRQNMMPTPTFRLQSRFKPLSCHKGIASTQMSIAMLMAAFDQAMALILKHLP